MLSEIPFSALTGWADYASREPFGSPSWDARIGHVLAVLVNAITGAKTRAADFIPQWGEPPPQDWRAMRDTLHAGLKTHADNRKD